VLIVLSLINNFLSVLQVNACCQHHDLQRASLLLSADEVFFRRAFEFHAQRRRG
jgi:hypothetical protein